MVFLMGMVNYKKGWFDNAYNLIHQACMYMESKITLNIGTTLNSLESKGKTLIDKVIMEQRKKKAVK